MINKIDLSIRFNYTDGETFSEMFFGKNMTSILESCNFERRLSLCVNTNAIKISKRMIYEYETVHEYLMGYFVYALVLIPIICTISIILNFLAVKATQKYKEMQEKAKEIKQTIDGE